MDNPSRMIQEFCASKLETERDLLQDVRRTARQSFATSDGSDDDAGGESSANSGDSLKMETRALPIMFLGKGFTSLHHKLDALLHAFRLELGGEQQMLAYNKHVISCCSDQGVECGIAVASMINLKSFVEETAGALDIAFAFDIPKSLAVSDKKANTWLVYLIYTKKHK